MPPSRADDSFPYLHLSRRLITPYSTVLAYVEAMTSDRAAPDLPEADKMAIYLVWRQEHERQVAAKQALLDETGLDHIPRMLK